MEIRSTTIICVRNKNGDVAMAADGQASFGETVIKNNVRKIQVIENNGDKILVGYAGSAADALTLIEYFEMNLKKNQHSLTKASIDLAKEWRMNKRYERLNATLLVANNENTYILTGAGDVIEPNNNIGAIGSGGAYAQSAALAYFDMNPEMPANLVAYKAIEIAGNICIYTNTNIIVEEIKAE